MAMESLITWILPPLWLLYRLKEELVQPDSESLGGAVHSVPFFLRNEKGDAAEGMKKGTQLIIFWVTYFFFGLPRGRSVCWSCSRAQPLTGKQNVRFHRADPFSSIFESPVLPLRSEPDSPSRPKFGDEQSASC